MTFHSILFEKANANKETMEMPVFFVDLNLDQVIAAVTAGKEEYRLKPFYYTPVRDLAAIGYRYEIMRELQNENLMVPIKAFAKKMLAMRAHLAQANQLHYKYQKERWFLNAVELYCQAVLDLEQALSPLTLTARGFLAFRDYLSAYTQSSDFIALLKETSELTSDFSKLRYCLQIKGNSIKVRKYDNETDYSVEVEKTFAKFRQDSVKDYRLTFPARPEMNHVEDQILALVAKFHPVLFQTLSNYCTKHANYQEETLRVFDREIQFYLAYLEYMAKFRQAGLKFCQPFLSDTCKEIYNYEGFDLALAAKLMPENSPVICNDFHLKAQERIFVVSGPNQGGKTTFARTFGQLHYLARLGCPVPGKAAQLFLYDNLFTHFEKEETSKSGNGKLQDDLLRIYDILSRATPDSIIILNEIFTSTTLKDAVILGKKIMKKIIDLDLLCVCVTFIDELTSLSEKTVSLVSTVNPENTATRTYKIVIKPADGRLYAISIAEKYRLTYAAIKERISS
jgi:DNA mismatch repair ATPase MutS